MAIYGTLITFIIVTKVQDINLKKRTLHFQLDENRNKPNAVFHM